MKMNGKVLFFNENSGDGIIITSAREKITFTVVEWNDFDVMPRSGLEVVFDYTDSFTSNIVSKDSEYIEETKPATEKEAQMSADTEKAVPTKEPETVKEEVAEPLIKEIVSSPVSAAEIDSMLAKISAPQAVEPEQNEEPSQEYEEDPDESEAENDEESIAEQEVAVETTPQATEEAFETDENISRLDVEEELARVRPDNITNTMNVHTAVSNYFKTIRENIEKRSNYKKVTGRLDYLIIRRFLWTTYNNLIDIDIHIITPKIRMLSDDLKQMGHIYDDFMRKTRYPAQAYEEVFLSSQAEYQKIREGAQNVVEKIGRLKASEKHLGGMRGVKKKELEEGIKTEQFDVLKNELKSLNGAYVDVVHMMAELDEKYKQDMKILTEFEAEYREDFYELFSAEAHKHKDDLVDILNAQAFFFDQQQWEQAKTSKSVNAHFKKSSISGELNTKTYLKYFLSTQSKEKANTETKRLFELYDYLCSVQKDHILVVTGGAQEAIEYETAIKSIDKSYSVKSFIDELKAIKWAMKNSVKILVIEDQLAKVRAEKFLDVYTKNVLSTPKIVLLGRKPANNNVSIGKLLSNGASSRVVAQSVKDLFEEDSLGSKKN